MFQSTPSRRGRPTPGPWSHLPLQFQSTPSRRGRLFSTSDMIPNSLFQSTPSRRGRLSTLNTTSELLTGFNPLPHAEGDPSLRYRRIYETSGFNPLPHAEGDQYVLRSAHQQDGFQSTPSRRGRQLVKAHIAVHVCFNPLPHAEGDAVDGGCGPRI